MAAFIVFQSQQIYFIEVNLKQKVFPNRALKTHQRESYRMINVFFFKEGLLSVIAVSVIDSAIS